MGAKLRETKTRRVITDIEGLGPKYKAPKPHLNVSDGIPDDAALDAALSGRGCGYIRTGGHPDHVRLERKLAKIEGGGQFRVRSDGMGAILEAVHGALELKNIPNPEIIAILPVYGTTYEALRYLERSAYQSLRPKFLYMNDPKLLEKLECAITKRTAAVLFETEANPTLDIPDIRGIIGTCERHPARPVTIVDDTFLFGILKPFRWGADVVVGSGTKYLSGESAWSLGYCGVSQQFLARCPEFWTKANEWANIHGGTLGPVEAWLTGTFSVNDLLERVKTHSKNALEVAQLLEEHPCVERVIYPGLLSYPWRDRALQYINPIRGRQVFGGMISFSLKSKDLKTAKKFLYRLSADSHIQFKASLAGPDDMVESPALLSHRNLPERIRKRCGITDNLIRLSIGRLRSPAETMGALDRSLWAVTR